MITLIDFETNEDLLFPLALKATNLHIHSKGKVSVLREDLSTRTNYAFKGIEDKDQLLIGCLDLKISKSLVVEMAVFLDTTSASVLKEVSSYLVKYCRAAGMRKIQLTIFCGVDGVADFLKEEGFLPEIKYRSHLFVGGKMFSFTEYGVIL